MCKLDYNSFFFNYTYAAALDGRVTTMSPSLVVLEHHVICIAPAARYQPVKILENL